MEYRTSAIAVQDAVDAGCILKFQWYIRMYHYTYKHDRHFIVKATTRADAESMMCKELNDGWIFKKCNKLAASLEVQEL